MRWARWGLGVTLILGGSLSSWAQEEAPPTVRAIEVRFVGLETVNRAVVMANIQTAVGKPLAREVIEQDVRNLINTGYFSDVRVLQETVATGVKVIYQVQGKATVKEIVFEGYKYFKETRVKRDAIAPGSDMPTRG